MGTQPSFFVFDYAYYEGVLVPALRDFITGKPASGFLADVIARFATRYPPAKPFRMPERGYCQFLAEQAGSCFCLRPDLGLEPSHYIFSPDHGLYRPLEPQDAKCGLFAGMNRWFANWEDLIELFNALVAANCLSQEVWLSRQMYLWDWRIERRNVEGSWPWPCKYFLDGPIRRADSEYLEWIWRCLDFLERSEALFLALYRRGCHLGSYTDPGGIMGWLTPEEVRELHDVMSNDLLPPPFERPKDWSDYEAAIDYEIYDDLKRVEAICRLAVSSGSGLAGSYSLCTHYKWAEIRSRCDVDQ